MGRKGDGVIIREKSIRLAFSYEGKPVFRTITLNGKSLPPTSANVKYAHRLAQEIRDKIRLGTFSMAEYFPDSGDVAGEITVSAQLDKWLKTQRIEESTKAGYLSAIRFWKEASIDDDGTPLGPRNLRATRKSDVMAAIASRPDLTGKTVNNYLDILRAAFQLAVDDKVLTENPAADIKRLKHQKEPPDPFEPADRDRIIDCTRSRHPEQVWNFVEFWFWAGLRTSELFGLTWQQVDFSKGTVRINRANVRGQTKERTKNNVIRDVKLNSVSLAAITRQKAHTFLADAAVFNDPRYGTPWADERAFRRSFWTPTLKRLGIRYRRPYNMRHTYATVMLMAGMNHSFCARQLGHSVAVFQTTYTKWIDGIQDDQEMARLEGAMGNSCHSLATTSAQDS